MARQRLFPVLDPSSCVALSRPVKGKRVKPESLGLELIIKYKTELPSYRVTELPSYRVYSLPGEAVSHEGGQGRAIGGSSQPSPPRGGVFSSIKSALQGWNSRGADQGDSEPGAAGEGARLSPRAPVLRLAVLLWSAALLAPLPRQAEVEPGRSTLARHLLGRVALLPAAPAHAQSTGICDRTPAVRTAILGRISGITDCRNVTSSHLSGITGKLDVSRRRLTSLQENDFDGLSNLRNSICIATV